ncbi:MAG: hypothetical protein KOO61_00295 [Spirochaetales bacterium]|nr:hypothetical protein [Spirochaetales bacterium]
MWVDFKEKFHNSMIPHFYSGKSPHVIIGSLAKPTTAGKAIRIAMAHSMGDVKAILTRVREAKRARRVTDETL